MNHKLEYAREKLHNAVLALSVGTGTIQSRLTVAGTELLVLSHPGGYLEGQLATKLEAIEKELTSKDAKADEGTLNATVHGMRGEKATNLARRIFDLYHEVLAAVHEG